jgi:methionyl-tRNA formyltransferase
MNLDKETGISIMKIVEELDSGPISNIYKIKLENNKNSQEISDKLSLLAAEKVLDEIDNILDDKVKFIDQEHSKATYAKKIDKAEGVINWNDKADIILGKINGLSPSPGAFFTFDGERYKVLKAEISNGLGKAGEVLNDKLEIACSYSKSLKILEIQRQGKKPQKISEFMLGSRIKKGTIISNV